MRITPAQIDRIAAHLPEVARDPASVRRRVEALEQLLESGFTMPGVGRRFGLDFLVGLIIKRHLDRHHPTTGTIDVKAMR
jgi:hypothetical protein